MPATVRQFLDLSTLHLPEGLGIFDDDWGEGAHVTALPRGWLLWVPDDPDESAVDFEVHPKILEIQRHARRHGCDYVIFDADGARVEDLAEYSW